MKIATKTMSLLKAKRDLSVVSGGVFLRALTGLLFAKLAASSLGAFKYATYGHYYMVATYIVTASSLGLGSAYSIYVSKTRRIYNEQHDDGLLILATSLGCGILLGLVTSALFLLDTHGIIVPHIQNWNLLWWFLFSVISALGAAIQSVLLGRQRHSLYQLASLMNPILSCVALYIVIRCSLATPSIVIFTYMLGFLTPLLFILPAIKGSLAIDLGAFRRLYEFSVPYFVPSLLIPTLGTFATLYVRHLIEAKVSVRDLGLWQGLWRLSEGYMGAIISVGSSLFIPKFSRIATQKECFSSLRKAIILLLAIYAPLACSFIIIPKTVVSAILSPQFVGISSFLPVQICGDALKICFFALQLLLTCMLLPKLALMGEILFSLTFVTFTVALETHSHSPEGAVIAYSLSYLVIVCLFIPITFRQIKKLPLA